MIEGGRPLKPSNQAICASKTLGSLMYWSQALSQTIDDLFVARVLLTQLLREGSLGQPQRLGDPLSVGFALRRQFLQFVLD
jgi:hypothetical protein